MDGEITNKQMALTRLVDAKFLGFKYLTLNHSVRPSILYLVATTRLTDRPPYRFNICAIERKSQLGPIWVDYMGERKPAFTDTRMPLDVGPELVEKHYAFLTYNTMI
jgi:hypothetical protein